jgi:hypothetical protein
LIHCKPYHSWSKGKIERFFSTVQVQFLPTLVFEPVATMETLNARLWKWLETDYHQRAHGALSGESPAGRFARLGTSLRLLEKDAPLGPALLHAPEAPGEEGCDLLAWEATCGRWRRTCGGRSLRCALIRSLSPGWRCGWESASWGSRMRCNKHRNSKVRIITNDYDREIY